MCVWIGFPGAALAFELCRKDRLEKHFGDQADAKFLRPVGRADEGRWSD